MKSKLSASALKHEAFVLALLSGMTAADAARKAGYGRKNINVRIVAWELLQRGDIQRRLREVAEATTDEAIMTVIQRKVRLSELARDPDSEIDPIRCIEELNKMDGLYRGKPAQVSLPPIVSVSVDQTARSKISARIERQENITIEGGDMDSVLVDRCSEEQDTKNSEVTYGKQRRGTTSIFPSQIR